MLAATNTQNPFATLPTLIMMPQISGQARMENNFQMMNLQQGSTFLDGVLAPVLYQKS